MSFDLTAEPFKVLAVICFWGVLTRITRFATVSRSALSALHLHSIKDKENDT